MTHIDIEAGGSGPSGEDARFAYEQSVALGTAVTRLALIQQGVEPFHNVSDEERAAAASEVVELLGATGAAASLFAAGVEEAAQEQLAQQVGAEITRQGKSYRSVAAASGVSHTTVGDVIEGTASVRAGIAVAKALDIPL